MTKIKFTGFPDNAEVTVSATARGVTKGPLTIYEWRQLGGGDFGDMTITMSRASVQIAPEVIHLSAVFNGTTGLPVRTNGDVTATAKYDQYDQQAHELEFVWSFGLTGTFDKVDRLPTDWRQRNLARGKHTSVVYETPGTYQIICDVYRTDFVDGVQESTWLGRKRETVTVADASTHYTSNVYCISSAFSNGDDANAVDSDAPAGSVGFPTYQALRTTLPQFILRDDTMVLFKRGETHTFFSADTEIKKRLHYGAYGTGARPVINLTKTYSHRSDGIDFIKFVGLDIRGGWDAVNETGTNYGITLESQARTAFIDCELQGLRYVYAIQRPGSAGADTNVTFWDTEVTGWQDYGILYGSTVDDALSGYMRGTKIAQDPNASCNMVVASKDGVSNDHGPVRFGMPDILAVDQCDFFSNNSWGQNARAQPCFRIGTNAGEGWTAQIMRSVMEGGEMQIISGTANEFDVFPVNVIVDSNILIGSWTSGSSNLIGKSASSFTRNIMVMTDVQCSQWIVDGDYLNATPRGGNAIGVGLGNPGDATATLTHPIRVFGNTFIDYLTYTADDADYEMDTITPNLALTFNGYKDIRDNIVHKPNRSVAVTAELGASPTTALSIPLYVTKARFNSDGAGTYADYTQANNGESIVHPGGSVNILQPASGAGAVGAATGAVGRIDALGNLRPSDPGAGALETP